MTRISAPIREVVIVGGGTAGWMTAAAMSRLVAAGVSVTLIESDAIGTVGVGEATIPSLHDFLRMIGVEEDAFVRATHATFKLGIEFVDWGVVGDRYLHPFGRYGRDIEGVGFHHLWLRQAGMAQADAGSFSDYNLCAVAARMGRFTRPDPNPATVLSSLAYAFHFDAARFAGFLRQHCEQAGVRRIEGRIDRVRRDPESGFITGLTLDDGREVAGELFVDCSGFRSLLLGDAMGVPFESWQRWLLNDSAFAVASEAATPPPPFTRAIAGQAGWRWRIPLQQRTGNGHVYASAFLDDETALRELIEGLEGQAIADARKLRFTAGVRERLWDRNCVAIGLIAMSL